MAKKKLNKKVAIAGSIVLVLFALAVIWYILYKMQGPQKFIDDGDAAVVKKDYETASKQYGRALSRAKKDIELQKKILFKLSDTHILNNNWRNAMACWNKIKTIDTSEKVSRAKLLDFYYDMADTGQYGAWKIVLTSVDELLPLEPNDAKLYLIKGRAKLELAKGGEVADRVEALTEAINILKKAQELVPSNPNVYRYRAEAEAAKGEELASKGSLEEKNKAQKQAQKLLEKAISVAPKDPNAYIQLLNTRLIAAQDKKQIGALEPDYIALTKKFPESADVFANLVLYYNYYDLNKQDVSDIDKALKAAQQAHELGPQSVKHAITAADIYYRKGSLTKDEKYLQKALDIAKDALTLPSAMDTQSSREYANKMNKLSLNTFLAHRYIERILDLPAGASKQQKNAMIADAEQVVHEVSQIWGSGEQPYVIEAEGMLAYAKGDSAEGIRKMYAAYQQLRQSDPKGQDAQLGQLSYVLARAFENSSEIGAAREFLLNALQRRIHFTKPETLLMYARISLPMGQSSDVINVVDMYEKIAGATAESQLLKARAYLEPRALQLDEAQSLLAKMKSDDPNVIATKISLLQKKIEQASAESKDPNAAKAHTDTIQAEIDKYRNEQTTLAQKLLQSEPNATQALSIVVENYLAKNKIQEAKAFVGTVLARAPNNTVAAFYKLMLAEPDPLKISPQRRMAISGQITAAIHDPVKRALATAEYYKSRLSEEAEECYKSKSSDPKIAAVTDMQKRSLTLASILAECYKSNANYDKIIAEYNNALKVDSANKAAIGGIFDNALQANDFSLAEQTASVAKRENIDLCGGQIFMARLALTKKDYKEALSRLDAAIKERPVSAIAYLLRSSTQSELGNEQLAIEDARKSIELNPADSMAAKNLANMLYQRNLKLGSKVSTEQVTETRTAIERAYASNPRDWQLLSFYAEYIRDTDPMRALSIRQQLQKAVPTAQNAMLLGNLAVKLAAEQKDTAQQKAFFDIAASAYDQGYKLDPNDSALLRSYAEFYNMTGKPQQAQQLLSNAANKNLLWAHQIRMGQFEQAKQTLDALYKENPKNIDLIKGQMLVAQNLGNAEGVTKYSQELLSFENTPENQLAQIEAYLQVNLIEQAQKQLASYMEKHPNDNRTMLLQALLAIRKGQFTEAITFINKNLELKPNDATSWNLKGQIDFSRGNFDDAINDFKKAKSIAPNPQIRTALTRAYFRAGKGDDAIKELVTAIDETPGATDLYLMLEETYSQLGKADSLTRFYQDTIKKFPDTPFWYNRAASFAISQKNFDAAAALSKAALELSQKPNPNMPKEAMLPQAQMALGNYLDVMRLKKQYDQLITYAAQYVDSDLAVIAFAAMADAKAELGDKAKAFEYYNKAMLKAASNDAVVFQLLGKMSNAVGEDETIKWCSQQLKTTPDSLPINLAMCNIMRSGKETGKALTYIDKCIQLTGPKNSSYRNFIDTKQAILLEAYTATSDKKYFNEAVKLYEDLVAGSSSVEVGALNNLAYLLASNDENIDKAVEYIKKAYDAVQNNPNIVDTYAYVLYKKGDYAKALQLAQSAVQMFERASVSAPADAYEHLGMISAKLGRKTEAANAYKQALKIGEKNMAEKDKQRITAAIAALK